MTRLNRFQEHPASVGETYFEHAAHAISFGWSMLKGSAACYIHAAFPWLHLKTGSQTVIRLHSRMVINRSRAQLDEMYPPQPGDYLAENI
jgi:hypothetical protein